MIGSWRCLLVLRLVGVIALVLVFRQSFENRSMSKMLAFIADDQGVRFVVRSESCPDRWDTGDGGEEEKILPSPL